MVQNRFYDAATVPFDELIDDAYEKYLENFDYSEGEPKDREQFEDYYFGF